MGKYFTSFNGRLSNINLKEFDEARDRVLGMYSTRFGTTIVNQNNFVLTPEKGYEAISKARIVVNDKNLEMNVVLFCPGDATGNTENYGNRKLIEPACIVVRKTHKAIIPRRKDGITAEYIFPIGSATQEHFIMGLTSLEGWTIDPRSSNPLTILRYKEFGYNPLEYSRRMKEKYADISLKLEKTLWLDGDERIGDPHSIYCSPETSNGILQMVGFLGTNDESAIKFFERYEKKIIS